MGDLVLIGNGFDKAHGLRTDYTDFIRYIFAEAYIAPPRFQDLFLYREKGQNSLDDILLMPESELSRIIHWKNSFFQGAIQQFRKNNWCDFESFYFHLLSNHPIFRENPKLLNDEFQVIKVHLYHFLRKQQSQFRMIKSYEFFFEYLNSNSESLVLNFNYTNTVSEYLKKFQRVEQIQIHGELDNRLNPVIFGYAAQESEYLNFLISGNNEYFRNIKKHNYKWTSNEERLIEKLSKANYRIVILGHGCGISDRLILRQVFGHNRVHGIQLFYHEKQEDYFEKQVNIERVSINSSGFNKLINFSRSHRMPQYSDSEAQIESFRKFLGHWGNKPS